MTSKKEKGNQESPAIPDKSIAKNIEMFVSQIESLSKAIEPTMETLIKNFKKNLRYFDKFIETHGKKKKGKDQSTYYQLNSDQIPKIEHLRKELLSSSLAVRNVPITFIVSLVSQFDAYLGDILRTLFYMKPEILSSSQKGLTFSDLVSFSSIEAARDSIIEREIESVIRESHAAHFEWMENKFGIPLRKNLLIWSTFIELTERRNLFVHCNGVVSTQYLKACKTHGVVFENQVKVGDRLDADQEYFEKAFTCIFEIGVKLGHVLWRKMRPEEIEKADNQLNIICFDLLVDENYTLAQTMLLFATQILKKYHSDVTRRIFIVNLAIALKNLGDEKGCAEILKKDDWSACSSEFNLAVAVLEDRYEDAAKIMLEIGFKGKVGKEQYTTWPLFKQFRSSEEFLRAYKKVFRKEFTIEEKPPEKEFSNSKPRKRLTRLSS